MGTISFSSNAAGGLRFAQSTFGRASRSLESLAMRFSCLLLFVLFVSQFSVAVATAQQLEPSIDDHLAAGEFPIAIEIASNMPADQRDRWLGKIAQRQMSVGAPKGAFFTAQQLVDDDARSSLLGGFHNQRYGNPVGSGMGNGNPNVGNPIAGNAQGGVTQADFQPLINLIRNVIEPDSWDGGTGSGNIIPYPAGVFVAPDGTLKRISTDRTRAAERLRTRASLDSGNRSMTLPSEMRMVSLTRLERAAQLAIAQGNELDPMMEYLAGIYEIKSLFVFPETGDIVIAGPAGDWKMNDQGRPVNVETGKPVLLLDDLVVCLRNAQTESGKFGCSINPIAENLVATKKFLETSKLKGKKWSEELKNVIGQQDIEVFGIDPDTHAARVLIEADYRMKLIGMGLEDSVPEVPSYFRRLTDNQRGTASDIVRWWFTMNYDDIIADEDRTVFAFSGTGVKVLSETEFLDQQGQRIHTGKSNNETGGFARDFTTHFEKLADKYPVYRQLKNVFDLALVAGLIRDQKLDQRVGWRQPFFVGDDENEFRYRVRRDLTPKKVDSVMNEQVIKQRKERSTVIQRIVGVSGGIIFDANAVISAPMGEDTGELANQKLIAVPQADLEHWWWD